MTIKRPFNPGTNVDENDTLHFKRSLNRLGYYTPHKDIGMTSFPDREVFDSLKSFQRDHGLPATGTAKPGDETVSRLSQLISQNHGRTTSREKYGPPDCGWIYNEHQIAKENFRQLEARRKRLEHDIATLEREKSQLFDAIENQLIAAGFGSWIISIPLLEGGNIATLMRKLAEAKVQKSFMEKLQNLFDEYTATNRSYKSKSSQKSALEKELSTAESEVVQTLKELNQCQNKRR